MVATDGTPGPADTVAHDSQPPILVSNGRPRVVDQEDRLLLGALPSMTYPKHAALMSATDLLMAYTDGWVERRRETPKMGLAGCRRSCTALSPTFTSWPHRW